MTLRNAWCNDEEAETVYTTVRYNLQLKTVEVNYFNIYVTTNFAYNQANL